MVTVSILVGPTDLWAPLLITVVRAQICDHDNDTFASIPACTTAAAGWATSRRQAITLAAPGATPGGSLNIIESLRAGGGVDAATDAELKSLV